MIFLTLQDNRKRVNTTQFKPKASFTSVVHRATMRKRRMIQIRIWTITSTEKLG